MSHVLEHDGHDPHHEKPEGVFEQFETLEQQQSTYVLGMWSFIVTEVMFFGVIFMTYILYRWKYQPQFYHVHEELNIPLGGLNTFNLLISSFAVVMAVREAQKENYKNMMKLLWVVQGCALVFLVIKGFEYAAKIEHNHFLLWPGMEFIWTDPAVQPGIAKLFFSLYFAATGLHGVHVVIGMLVFGALQFLYWRKSHLVIGDYIPLELVGLYWHFVDLVWIFLYPLFYLIPK